MHRVHLPIAILAASAALAATAGVEDATRLLDQAAPRHCEILTMRHQMETIPAGAPRDGFADRMHRRADEVARELAEPMGRYEATVAGLTQHERDQVQMHALRLLRECASRASARYGVQLPIPTAEAAPARRAAPYRAPSEKKELGESAHGGVLQAQTPKPP